MIKSNTKNLIIPSFIIIISFAMSCQFDVPIKEMSMAKKSITRAKEVKADKYDPDNFDKANNHLFKCHTFLEKKKTKNSKEEAIKAYNAAELAIKNSLPSLSSDTLAEAKSIFLQAEKLYAEKFAPDEYINAKTLIEESEALNASESYWDSYLKSSKAIVFSSEAKNKSIDNIPKLKEEITRISSETSSLKSHPSASTIQNELSEIDQKIKIADQGILENDIKPAFENITEASSLLEKLKSKITTIDARARIKQLRQEAEELKKKRGVDFSSEELEKVFSSLNEADALLDQENTEDALKKINEAEEALLAAKKKTLKGIAEERIKNVEKLHNEISLKTTDDEAKKVLDNASTLITDAKNHLNEELFDESIKKSLEAETILNSITVSTEKDKIKDQKLETDQGEILQVYTVIYNKNKRDCLWRIAHKVYKNAKLWPLIYVANKEQIKDPDLIFPGQRFKIPVAPGENNKKDTTDMKEDKAIIEENKTEKEETKKNTENMENTEKNETESETIEENNEAIE